MVSPIAAAAAEAIGVEAGILRGDGPRLSDGAVAAKSIKEDKAMKMGKQRTLERIRAAILDHRYALSEHAYEEMDADGLDALDIEAAVLTGKIDQVLTHDPRGIRYTILGTGCDQTTPVGVVARFAEDDELLVLTVYQIR